VKGLGMILWISGIALAGYAFFVFDPSVDVGQYGYSRVVNADLQQRQMMMLVAGCALFVVGAVMQVVGASRSSAVPTAPSKSIWQAYKDEVARRDPAAAGKDTPDQKV
jgi:hypothetical protein